MLINSLLTVLVFGEHILQGLSFQFIMTMPEYNCKQIKSTKGGIFLDIREMPIISKAKSDVENPKPLLKPKAKNN